MHDTVNYPSISPTFLFLREPPVTPEQPDDHSPLRRLEEGEDHGEQEQGAHHLRGEGDLQDGAAQLDVLTACFHSDGPPLPEAHLFINHGYT